MLRLPTRTRRLPATPDWAQVWAAEVILLHMLQQPLPRDDLLTRIKDAYQIRRALQIPDVEMPLEMGAVLVVRVGIPLLLTAFDVAGLRQHTRHFVLVDLLAGTSRPLRLGAQVLRRCLCRARLPR